MVELQFPVFEEPFQVVLRKPWYLSEVENLEILKEERTIQSKPNTTTQALLGPKSPKVVKFRHGDVAQHWPCREINRFPI